MRGGFVLLCLMLIAVTLSGRQQLLTAGALVLLAALMAVAPRRGVVGLTGLYLEGLLAAALAVSTGEADSPLLPYLLAPAFLAGYRFGLREAIVVPGIAAGTLLLGRLLPFVDPDLQESTAAGAQWVLLAVASGVVGAWLRRLLTAPRTDRREHPQEAAHRLLVQLRAVARRLPGSLDPATTAEGLLVSLREVMPVERGVVLVRADGQRLVPLAHVGGEPLDWDLQLSSETALAETWATQQPQVRDRQHMRAAGVRPAGSSLVVPLTVGVRTFGLVAVEASTRHAYNPVLLRTASSRTDSVALALDTGLLFNEVRTLATAEERRRLAREVHDGIAQELVFLGYELDNIVAEEDPGAARAAASQVRGQVRRLVNELRMSLFDLRSAVDPQAGLGAALSEHVRSVGSATDLTVHLSLTEATLRLPPDREAELLRIAQEAVANARKHAGAANLWVACVVDPPAARLVVEDDGVGFSGPIGADSYGLEIMRERADRLGAELTILPRSGGGTRVEVSLGTLRGTSDAAS